MSFFSGMPFIFQNFSYLDLAEIMSVRKRTATTAFFSDNFLVVRLLRLLKLNPMISTSVTFTQHFRMIIIGQSDGNGLSQYLLFRNILFEKSFGSSLTFL